MTTDITELAQSEINDALAQLKQISEYPTPSTQYARVLRKYILALVEALEKAQQRIGKLEKKITDHKRMNQEMAKAMLTPNDSDAAGMEIAALRQRIAELESRTVKLPKPKNSDHGWKIDPEFINKVQDAIGYDDTCECWEGTPSMELVEAVLLAAAGIKVEDE
ncbi:Ead domain protein [Klebsiella pneumoniae]|nr:Ead domain protein [Klebsiella pneumoniae]